MDYENFYGLKEHPFTSSHDERFYYDSPQHSKAIMKLTHAAETMVGLGVLLGDVGAGKTTLARRILHLLSNRKDFETALLVMIHSEISPFWLLRKIALQFGVEVSEQDRTEIIPRLYERLAQLNENEKKAVVLIDEANMLQKREIMEELRGLLNIEVPEGHLLTFLLFGLPEMEKHLKLDEPLVQRIGIRCILEPLTPESSKGYILHRLKVAGKDGTIFSE
ncbi:AAA family ATPase, partial [candidate division TA06 bacterium]|nr:AAA family ATPase [candidate division TA06 bacterium]